MSEELNNGKDADGIIRPGAKLGEIFNRNLVILYLVGTLVATVMIGLIYSQERKMRGLTFTIVVVMTWIVAIPYAISVYL